MQSRHQSRTRSAGRRGRSRTRSAGRRGRGWGTAPHRVPQPQSSTSRARRDSTSRTAPARSSRSAPARSAASQPAAAVSTRRRSRSVSAAMARKASARSPRRQLMAGASTAERSPPPTAVARWGVRLGLRWDHVGCREATDGAGADVAVDRLGADRRRDRRPPRPVQDRKLPSRRKTEGTDVTLTTTPASSRPPGCAPPTMVAHRVAIVDEGGLLKALSRMDGAPPLSARGRGRRPAAPRTGREGDGLVDVAESQPGRSSRASRGRSRPILPALGSVLARRDGGGYSARSAAAARGPPGRGRSAAGQARRDRVVTGREAR